jgi:acyl-coenzyme A thioesterase PaaI-like protein
MICSQPAAIANGPITREPHINSENNILRWWHRLSAIPAGSILFSLLLGWFAPYSGTIRSRVEVLEPGYVRVILRDRRRVRNHLKSIHAIALINLGEIATGLALLTTLPANMRGIVLGLNAEYHKKARGKLTACASFEPPAISGDKTKCQVSAEIVDEAGDVVATIHANWLIGFKSNL